MELKKYDNGHVRIDGPISKPGLLEKSIPIDCERLTILSESFLSGEIAKALSNCQSLSELSIGCDVGRTAVRHLLVTN